MPRPEGREDQGQTRFDPPGSGSVSFARIAAKCDRLSSMRIVLFSLFSALLMGGALGSSSALAQSLDADEFSSSSFFPAAGAQNYLMVDGAQINGDISASAGAWAP